MFMGLEQKTLQSIGKKVTPLEEKLGKAEKCKKNLL